MFFPCNYGQRRSWFLPCRDWLSLKTICFCHGSLFGWAWCCDNHAHGEMAKLLIPSLHSETSSTIFFWYFFSNDSEGTFLYNSKTLNPSSISGPGALLMFSFPSFMLSHSFGTSHHEIFMGLSSWAIGIGLRRFLDFSCCFANLATYSST